MHCASRAVTCATAILWMPIGSTAFAQVVINEVHYRPSPSAVLNGEDPGRLQFVELYNAGTTTVDLSGWSIASAIRLTFPQGTSIASSEYLVVAADPAFLRERGPSIPKGVRVFASDGGGTASECVRLLDDARPVSAVVDELTFARGWPWPSQADGHGPSLELVNPRLSNDSARAWRSSASANGTPGAANSSLGEPIVISETPARDTAAVNVREISVTFSEEVKHVTASDLLVEGRPAARVTGSGAGPYVFAVSSPSSGSVAVSLRGNATGSRDDRVFAGDGWRYFAPLTTTLSMPDDASGGPGAIVQAPISAAPADGIFGIDMTLQYDPALLEAQGVAVSGIAASAGFALEGNLTTPGIIVVSTYATQDALVGSGEIARIQFQILGTPGSTSNLTFTSASINEHHILAALDSGLLTVTCAGATNGTACNDGNPCTADDTCQTNACTGGVPLQIPAEVAHLDFGADQSTITWDSAAAAGPGTVHDVLRGLVSQLPVVDGPAQSCLASGIPTAAVSDPAIPPTSESYWYLVRGRNACGLGTYGFREIEGVPGAERTSTTCP